MKNSLFFKQSFNTDESPIQQLKKAMRYEGIAQILALLFMCITPSIVKVSTLGFQIITLIYAYVIVVSVYYLWQFYKFYQQLDQGNTSHLAQLLELQIEKYKAWSLQIIPFAFVYIGIIFYEKGILDKIMIEIPFFIYAMSVIVLTLAFIWAISKYWLKNSYYKYVELLKTV